jgi:hypothetical protein
VYTDGPRTGEDRVDTPAASGPAVVTLSPSAPYRVSHPSVVPDVTRPAAASKPLPGDTATVPPLLASSPPVPAASLAGWSTFQIKKTRAELTETARLAEVPGPSARTQPGDVRLPPQHDVLRVSTGIGYLQGADWGGDVSAFGKINGMQTDVSAFFTAGPMGLQSRSAHLSIFAPGGKWRAEGGDLYSDLRGLARGARVSFSAGQRWTPSVSLYLHHRQGSSNAASALAYRDRFQLLPQVRVGGELTSDGAAFLQGQYAQSGVDLTAFYRFTRGPIAGHDKGVSGGVGLGRGVALSGAVRLSDAVGDTSRQWKLASVRVPLARQASVTLERSWWTGSLDRGSTNALVLQLPLGRVRLIQRLQWGRTDYPQRAVPFGFDRRQSQSTASYTPGPWGSVNYQQSTQWFDDGRVQQWDEVASMFQIGRRTSLQVVTAFPDLLQAQTLRGRLRLQLSPTLLLEAQYGRLSAFQMARAVEHEQSRVMVTVRKTWQVTSPSRGGEVRGRASDQVGHPVSGALVRLGPYGAITDAAGEYRFTRVPDGDFELALDRNKLPVAYAWDEQPRALTVAGGSREQVDLQVIPLNAIRGHVYLDRNGNGHFDEGEGVPSAVVTVNGAVTASTATGSYAFYNQPPGRYTIRLDGQRLAKGLAPASPVEVQVELTGDHPLVGIDFTVEKKDMPILMHGIGR